MAAPGRIDLPQRHMTELVVTRRSGVVIGIEDCMLPSGTQGPGMLQPFCTYQYTPMLPPHRAGTEATA
eukprot:3085261-Rhodomonas_salina.1